MLEDRKIHLVIDPSAEELLAREGFDPIYGARPLKRAIQSLIQNPLAMKLLGGEIKPNESVVIKGDLDRSQMVFTAEQETAVGGR
jgi:ATP-dependent Clp protease ATP-binding subunit ClpB